MIKIFPKIFYTYYTDCTVIGKGIEVKHTPKASSKVYYVQRLGYKDKNILFQGIQ